MTIQDYNNATIKLTAFVRWAKSKRPGNKYFLGFKGITQILKQANFSIAELNKAFIYYKRK